MAITDPQYKALLALKAADERYFVTVSDREPPSSDEEPYLPLDSDAWLKWHSEEFEPAGVELKAAKGMVAMLFDTPADWIDTSFPGHRMNYMPWLEKVLAQWERDHTMPRSIARHLPF